MEHTPSRGEQLRAEMLQKKARKKWLMLGMLFGGMAIIIGVGLSLNDILFLEFNRIFFAICSIFGGLMIVCSGFLLPDKNSSEDDRVMSRMGDYRRGRRSPGIIPLPMLIAIFGFGFVVSGIVMLFGG
jgi:hypothetical protein